MNASNFTGGRSEEMNLRRSVLFISIFMICPVTPQRLLSSRSGRLGSHSWPDRSARDGRGGEIACLWLLKCDIKQK